MVELESTQNFVDNQIIGKNTNLSKSAQLYKPDFQNKKNQLKKKNWQRKKPESVSRTFFKKLSYLQNLGVPFQTSSKGVSRNLPVLVLLGNVFLYSRTNTKCHHLVSLTSCYRRTPCIA